MLPQYEEVRYKDSAKVLKDIHEIIAQQPGLVIQLTESGSPLIDAVGQTVRSTLNRIEEVMSNAPTTKKTWTPRPAEADAMDPRGERSG